MVAATVASSEINWSAGMEAEMEGKDVAREPRRVVAISTGTEARIAEILKKREF